MNNQYSHGHMGNMANGTGTNNTLTNSTTANTTSMSGSTGSNAQHSHSNSNRSSGSHGSHGSHGYIPSMVYPQNMYVQGYQGVTQMQSLMPSGQMYQQQQQQLQVPLQQIQQVPVPQVGVQGYVPLQQIQAPMMSYRNSSSATSGGSTTTNTTTNGGTSTNGSTTKSNGQEMETAVESTPSVENETRGGGGGGGVDSTASKVKKRNKLSFNCISCRKRKSKCDHLKPKCTKCIKLGTECVYDTDTQLAPKRPNKDAMIARLSKQVEYWKNKALKDNFGSSIIYDDPISQMGDSSSTTGDLNGEGNHEGFLGVGQDGEHRRHLSLKTEDEFANSNTDDTHTFGNSSTYQPSEFELSTLSINPERIYIDFKTKCPKLMINNGVPRHLDIFSDIGLIQKDTFLRVFMSSVLGFSNNRNTIREKNKRVSSSSSSSSLSSSSSSSTSAQNLVYSIPQTPINNEKSTTLDNIMNSGVFNYLDIDTEDHERAQHFVNQIMTGKSGSNYESLSVHFSLFNNLIGTKTQFFEDQLADNEEPSAILKECIELLTSVLPTKAYIEKCKHFFYQKMYPSLAILDITLFEDSLSAVLLDDLQRPGYYKIDIGRSKIRHKMENLALLCIILRLSDVGTQAMLKRNYKRNKNNNNNNNNNNNTQETTTQDKDGLETSEKINPLIINVAVQALICLNIFVWTTESSICCLMYLWIIQAVAPEEADMFPGKPTDLIVNIITTLAFNTGLDKDPMELDYFKKNRAPKLINLRRKMNIHLTSMLLVENLFKGKIYFHDEKILSIKYQHFLQKMIETEPGIPALERKILSLGFRRTQLQAYISELYDHCRNDPTFSLASVEAIILKVDGFVEKNFMLSNLKKPTLNSEEFLSGTKTKVSSTLIENAYCVELVVFAKSHTLMVNYSIFLSLQSSSKDAKLNKNYFPFYKKYFIVLIHEVCVSFKLLEDFFGGKFNYALNYTESLTMVKNVTILANRLLFIILALLIRFSFTKHLLIKRLSRRLENIFNSKEIQARIEMLTKMTKHTTKILSKLCDCLSKKFRFVYLQSFKSLMFFDFIQKTIEKGNLCDILLRILNKEAQEETLTPEIIEVLKSGMSFDVKHSDDFLEELELSELLSFVPVTLLEEYLNTLVITEVLTQEELDKDAEHEKENKRSSILNLVNEDNVPIGQQFSSQKQADSQFDIDSFNIFDYDFLFKGS